MTADLQRLEELYGKATPGEWKGVPKRLTVDLGSGLKQGGPLMSHQVGSTHSPEGMHVTVGSERIADHELIAALHNAFPSLLARIRELEAELAEYVEGDRDNHLMIKEATDRILKLESQLAAAEARAAAMQGDAERYRWLRNQDENIWVRYRASDGLECDLFGHDLDAAIDAARSAKEE